MNAHDAPLALPVDAGAWERALYAFLAEHEIRPFFSTLLGSRSPVMDDVPRWAANGQHALR